MSVFLPATSFVITRANQNSYDNTKGKYGSFNEHVYLLSIREVTAETGNHGWVNILPASTLLPFFFFFVARLLPSPPSPNFVTIMTREAILTAKTPVFFLRSRAT